MIFILHDKYLQWWNLLTVLWRDFWQWQESLRRFGGRICGLCDPHKVADLLLELVLGVEQLLQQLPVCVALRVHEEEHLLHDLPLVGRAVSASRRRQPRYHLCNTVQNKKCCLSECYSCVGPRQTQKLLGRLARVIAKKYTKFNKRFKGFNLKTRAVRCFWGFSTISTTGLEIRIARFLWACLKRTTTVHWFRG